MLKKKSLVINDLITNEVSIDEYEKIYSNIENQNSIASIIKYPIEKHKKYDDIIHFKSNNYKNKKCIIEKIAYKQIKAQKRQNKLIAIAL